MINQTDTDFQEVFTYHLLQAEQARRGFVEKWGRDPELPFGLEQAWLVGSKKDPRASNPIIIQSTTVDELL